MINDWKRLAWEAPNLSHSLTTKYTTTPYACHDGDDDDGDYYQYNGAQATAKLSLVHWLEKSRSWLKAAFVGLRACLVNAIKKRAISSVNNIRFFSHF